MKNKLTAAGISAALMTGGMVSAPAVSAADFTANIGVTSNYVWRGATQTQNGPAVQGGLDYESDLGIYAGLWASNVDFGNEVKGNTIGGGDIDDNDSGNQYELDAYFGWGMDFTDNVGIDIGYVYYHYGMIESGSDFGELYGSVNFWWFEVGVAGTVNDQKPKEAEDTASFVAGDYFFWGSVAVPFGETWSAALTAGQYNFKNDGELVPVELPDGRIDLEKADYNYAYYQVDISKSMDEYGDITLSYSQADEQADGNDSGKVFITWTKGF